MDFDALIAMLPATWAEGVGYLVAFLMAVRTLLRALVAIAIWLDTAKDGERNWGWPGALAEALDWVDGKTARFGVHVPGMLEKRKHATPARAVKS